jgi:hypothetical protein
MNHFGLQKTKATKEILKALNLKAFRIWLSDNPVDKDLKDALLGK